MRYTTARVAIHAAYLTGEKGIDPKDVAEKFGISRSRLSDDIRIVQQVECGYIQKAMDRLKERDRALYAWNMFAYAPPGAAHGFERSWVLEWLVRRYLEETGVNPLLDMRLQMLARIAMQDYALMDRQGSRRRRPNSDFDRALMLPAGEYKQGSPWHRAFYRFYDYCKELPERSLPPIGKVIGIMLDQAEGDPDAAERLRKELGVAA
ncbi:hypothetical protein [Gilvimarinus chinensis]|uniref:hypothetical protein n=1 Tax=Gilvimarinus chinensis TaxID=396005 RepID=UPI0003823D38|nr:hypothetical protein [Gilvimarinus chinensis]